MILKTGRECTWEDIEVGEVFASRGCWVVCIKISERESRLIAHDQPKSFWIEFLTERNEFGAWYNRYCFENSGYPLYKLPKSVQALWKEE